MNFEISLDQKELVRMVREFCCREIDPHVSGWDRAEHFPVEVFRKMGELGLTGIPIPEEYGGGGGSFTDYILALEELSKHDAGFATAYAVHLSAHALSILSWGSPEQKSRYLPKLSRGEWLGAFALTEPHCGSDAAALRTRADRDGDSYVLNGTKQWITSAKSADLFLLFARTDSGIAGTEAGATRAKGITAFLIEKDTPGLVIDRKTHKLGMRTSETYDVLLKDCRLPASSVIGPVGEGFKIAMKTLDGGRIGIAAQALGIGQASLDEAKKFAKEREAFGQPIARFQAIQWKIADMATQLGAGRMLTYRAAWLKDQGLPHTKEGAMAKLLSSRAAREATQESLQVHGGYGFTEEFPIERHYRDVKVTEIYEGTSEVQKIVISRALLATQRKPEPALR